MFIIILVILSVDSFAQEKPLADTSAVSSINGIVNEVLKIITVEKSENIDLE